MANPSAGKRNQSNTGFGGTGKTMKQVGSTAGLKGAGPTHVFQKDDPGSVMSMDKVNKRQGTTTGSGMDRKSRNLP